MADENKEEEVEKVEKTDEYAKKWTDEVTEKFINELERHPCLYNTTIKEYHDRNKRKQSYDALSEVMHMTGSVILDCLALN